MVLSRHRLAWMRYVRTYVRGQVAGDRDEPGRPPYALRSSGPSPARVTDGLTVKVSSPVSSRVSERVQTKRSGHAPAPPARSVLGTLLALVHYGDRRRGVLSSSRSHVAQAQSFTLLLASLSKRIIYRTTRAYRWKKKRMAPRWFPAPALLCSALSHDDAACPPADRLQWHVLCLLVYYSIGTHRTASLLLKRTAHLKPCIAHLPKNPIPFLVTVPKRCPLRHSATASCSRHGWRM